MVNWLTSTVALVIWPHRPYFVNQIHTSKNSTKKWRRWLLAVLLLRVLLAYESLFVCENLCRWQSNNAVNTVCPFLSDLFLNRSPLLCSFQTMATHCYIQTHSPFPNNFSHQRIVCKQLAHIEPKHTYASSKANRFTPKKTSSVNSCC